MKANFGQDPVERPAQARPGVKVSPNPTKTSIWIDADGNEVERRRGVRPPRSK